MITHQVDRWFYISVALLMILLNLIAFGPSIIDQTGRNVPLPFTPLVTVHVIVSIAWLLLFLTQTISPQRHAPRLIAALGSSALCSPSFSS